MNAQFPNAGPEKIISTPIHRALRSSTKRQFSDWNISERPSVRPNCSGPASRGRPRSGTSVEGRLSNVNEET